jgi:hypothetical protein
MGWDGVYSDSLGRVVEVHRGPTYMKRKNIL